LELAKQFAGGIVREAKITVKEFLIEDGSPEKTPHLLFFDWIARDRQNVTAPGKDYAGNLSFEWGKRRTFLPRRIKLHRHGVTGCDLRA